MSQALFELDQITIASPCQVSWEAMQGDERSRHCGECKLQVFNLAGMSRAEAQQLVQSRQGRLAFGFTAGMMGRFSPKIARSVCAACECA